MDALNRCWSPGDLAFWLGAMLTGNPDGGRAETNERLGDGPWIHALDGLTLHDRREEIRGPKHARGKPRPPRPWSQIFGTTWHQTASGLLHPDHPGILSIPAHILVHQDGSISLLHPLCLRMQHGHALNGPTIGVEVDAREPGIVGDRRTFWRSKAEIAKGLTMEDLHRPVTAAQLEALPKVADFCHGAFWALAPVANRSQWGTYIHLQGHKSRTSDPGQQIALAVDRHRRRRGWKDTRDEHYGSGRPWPQEWRAA